MLYINAMASVRRVRAFVECVNNAHFLNFPYSKGGLTMSKEWNIEIPIGLARVAKLYLNAVGVKWHCHEYSDTRHLLYYTEPADIDLQYQVQYVLETLASVN